MTDFIVTKEDIGRIALDAHGWEWELVHWRKGDRYPATWRCYSAAQTSNTSGEYGDIHDLIQWKSEKRDPRVIWMTFSDTGKPTFIFNTPQDGAVKFVEVLDE